MAEDRLTPRTHCNFNTMRIGNRIPKLPNRTEVFLRQLDFLVFGSSQLLVTLPKRLT